MPISHILQIIIEFIRFDLLVSFTHYSVLYFIYIYFTKDKVTFLEFDNSVIKLVIRLAILWAVLQVVSLVVQYFELPAESRSFFLEQLNGDFLGFFFAEV